MLLLKNALKPPSRLPKNCFDPFKVDELSLEFLKKHSNFFRKSEHKRKTEIVEGSPFYKIGRKIVQVSFYQFSVITTLQI